MNFTRHTEGRARHLRTLAGGTSSVALLLALGALTTVAASAQEQLETIVVTGVRASLESALNIKRNSAEVVDSIVAQDIGKLQDSNVAETMTRIPGVTGYRYGGEGASPVGVGSGLTIRGLSGLTASRLDGRAFFTAGQREFNIEQADPGMVAGIDVFKNPGADKLEGGIGGLVNIRTHQPLDFKGLVVSASVTERMNDLTHSLQPAYTSLFSNRWNMGELGEMGFLFAASYDTSNNRSDNNPGGSGANLANPIASTDTANYTAANGCNMTYAGVANTTCMVSVTTAQAQAMTATQRQALVSMASVQTPVNEETIKRERIGVSAAFQWRIDPKLELYANANYVHYLYNQNYRFLAITDTKTVQNLTTTPYVLGSGVVLRDSANTLISGTRFKSGTFIGDTMASTGGDEHHPYGTTLVAGGAKWHPTDQLDVSFDVSYVSSDVKVDNRAVQMNSAAGLGWNVTRDVSSTPHQIAISGPDLSNASSWVLNSYTNGTNSSVHDEGETAQLDLVYTPKWPVITDIKFGGRYGTQTDRSYNYSFTSAKNLTTDGLALASNQSNAISASTYAYLLQGSPTNWMHNEAGYGGGYLVFSPDALLGDNVRNLFTLAGVPASASLPEQLASRRYAKENNAAAYIKADYALLDGVVEGDFGGRVVQADDTFTAQVANVSGVGFTPRTTTKSRVDVLLSANVVYHINEELQMKFGYGQGLARPDFGTTNPTISVNTSVGTGGVGNADIKPITSTSYDLSLEYYPAAGTAVAIDVFDKEINGLFTTVGSCQTVPLVGLYTGATANGCSGGQYFITQTVNAAPGYARGLEVSGQTFFDFLPSFWSHFGVQGSWSYVETQAPIRLTVTGPLVNLPQQFQSKNSASVSALYDDGDLSARLIYTYRSDFNFNGYSANPIDSRAIHGYGLLDASVSYDIGYNISLSASVSNITNGALNRYQGEPGQYRTVFERQHYDNGRIFGLGVRFKLGD